MESSGALIEQDTAGEFRTGSKSSHLALRLPFFTQLLRKMSEEESIFFSAGLEAQLKYVLALAFRWTFLARLYPFTRHSRASLSAAPVISVGL